MDLELKSFKQEGVQMYVGVMKVRDILQVSEVDVWHQDDGEETGYQRAPETSRTGKVSRYLQSDSKPLMPTSVLLSYRGTLTQKGRGRDGTVTLEFPENETLWIVDGQHRLGGFRRAIEESGVERLNDYELPVVIVENPSLEDEATQFRIINETMKKVRTDLARRILAIQIASLGRKGRQVARGQGRLWEAVAVEIIKTLSTEEDSPWYGRIQPPNTRKQAGQVIRELSFSTSLKPLLNELPYRQWTAERVAKALKIYWQAVRDLMPEAFEQPDEFVVQKTPGVFSLHQLALHVLGVLRAGGINDPSVEDVKNVLTDLDDYMTAGYWRKDNGHGAAIAGSMKGFTILADDMQDELVEKGHTME